MNEESWVAMEKPLTDVRGSEDEQVLTPSRARK